MSVAKNSAKSTAKVTSESGRTNGCILTRTMRIIVASLELLVHAFSWSPVLVVKKKSSAACMSTH
jgi:hypothetical protein